MKTKLKENIKLIATNKEVQKTIVHAMFNRCEIGSDLFEYLGHDSEKYPKNIQLAIFGQDNPDDDHSIHVANEKNCALYFAPIDRGNSVIRFLLKEVSKEIFK